MVTICKQKSLVPLIMVRQVTQFIETAVTSDSKTMQSPSYKSGTWYFYSVKL